MIGSGVQQLPFTPAHQGGPHPIDFIFDSNAVRALAVLEKREWRRLEAAWLASNLRAAWVPNVMAEVMGTNLRRRALTFKGLRELQVGVERYHTLARGEVLPRDEDMVRGSILTLAGLVPPVPTDPDPPWQSVVDFFLNEVNSPDQIEFRDAGTSLSVILKDRRRSGVIEIVIPRGFSEFVRKKTAAMRARRGYTGTVPRVQQVRDLIDDIPRWFLDVGRRLSLPADVLDAAVRNREGFMGSAFAARMLTENMYYHHRATGYTSKVEESDAQDIALSTYVSAVWGIVTDDRRLKNLFLQVIEDERRVMAFAEFGRLVDLGLSRS